MNCLRKITLELLLVCFPGMKVHYHQELRAIKKQLEWKEEKRGKSWQDRVETYKRRFAESYSYLGTLRVGQFFFPYQSEGFETRLWWQRL